MTMVCVDGVLLRQVLHRLLCEERRLLVCVGTELREDDRVGLEICRALAGRGYRVLECEYGLENCFSQLAEMRPGNILIVDAVYHSDSEPGDVVIVSEELMSEDLVLTTHTIPMKLLLETLRREGAVRNAVVLGIRIRRLGVGFTMSEVVASAAEKLVELIEGVLRMCPGDAEAQS